MLKHLHIQNYALIDHLQIDFQKGLNIITGETGAGKSILLGALGLILGQRADSSVLKSKSRSCIVEGLFDLSAYNLQPLFDENDLDYYNSTIIRRQINEAGKSRAFINEIPVTLPVLKSLVERIIDIHSQHQNLLLAESTFQLSVLDAFAGTTQDLASYTLVYNKYRKLSSELARLKEQAETSQANFDYLQHQQNELVEANLQPGEMEELEDQLKQLTHADDIKTALQLADSALSAEDKSVISILRLAEGAMARIASVFSPAEGLAQRMESCRIELRDIADEIGHHDAKLEVDPSLMERVSLRLDLLYSLQQKHRLSTIEELIELRDRLTKEVADMEGFDINIEELERQLAASTSELSKLGEAISAQRVKQAPKLEASVTELLKELGMPYASFAVRVEKQTEFKPDGVDQVAFLFSANKQVAPQELSRVASGGELSRLMLTLKSLMVKTKGLPTIIFDEIDSGVSGEVAHRMGNIINAMAQGMQVVNITHLPQIASKGSCHFLVYKDNQTDTSTTRIKLLNQREREVEIAKMLSGESLSEAAIENARELLGG